MHAALPGHCSAQSQIDDSDDDDLVKPGHGSTFKRLRLESPPDTPARSGGAAAAAAAPENNYDIMFDYK